MKVGVHADIVCAPARLGIHRFHRAVADGGESDVELVLRPYLLDPDASEEPQPMLEVMSGMFGREGAEAAVAEMTRIGAAEGLEYRSDRALTVSTVPAHSLLWPCRSTAPGSRPSSRASCTTLISGTASTSLGRAAQ